MVNRNFRIPSRLIDGRKRNCRAARRTFRSQSRGACNTALIRPRGRILQSFEAESYNVIVTQRSFGRFETLRFGWRDELGAAQAARESFQVSTTFPESPDFIPSKSSVEFARRESVDTGVRDIKPALPIRVLRDAGSYA